jgi:hypothetical protein
MNGKALLILITRAAGFLGVSFLWLSLLAAGIPLYAQAPGASTSLRGGADVATRTDAGNADAAQSGEIHPLGVSMEWSTYLGGSGADYGYGIAVDGAGNVLVTGYTQSSGWVSGGFDTTFNSGDDAFVVKLSESGAHLWSTYLGGSGLDGGRGIAVDDAGNVFVTGYTGSSGWVSGGFDTTLDGGGDAFVVKLSGSGAHLWSTYVGGSSGDDGRGIAVDGAGNVFVTGDTWSFGWVSGGFDTTHNGDRDAFVVKLSGSGVHLWSTYLGGSSSDRGSGIAVDGEGNVFVTGDTWSLGWVSGGFDTTLDGGEDGFVVKLSENGQPLWSTYLGGSDLDSSNGIAVDGVGNVFVTGETDSPPSWVSGGFDTTYNGGYPDAFVVKLSGSGAHLWSTYLGGSRGDSGEDIAVDHTGNVFVTGWTASAGWVSGGFDTTFNGYDDAFVVELSRSGAHLWSSYLGGSSDDYGYGIAVDGAGNVFVTGGTDSPGWVSGGFDTTYNGGEDAFVAKVKNAPGPLCVTIVPPECVAAGAQWRRVGTTSWLDSGYTESEVLPGVYTVEFKNVSGWTKPGEMEVTISAGQTTNATGIYQQLGGTLEWSTYLGGNDDDRGWGIAVDSAGNVLVTGETWSSGWVSGGFDTAFNGVYDAFVVKLSGSGVHLWSAYLGGNGSDCGYGIAVDGSGNAFVTGRTTSSGWVSGGFDTTYNGGGQYAEDAFVVKLSGGGTHLWSTYLGGSGDDWGNDIAVDSAGRVFVTGSTGSSGWVSGGFGTTYNGGNFDAFVAVLSGNGAHLWSTYLGGNDHDYGSGVAVDQLGNVFVTGSTYSSDWVLGGGYEDAFAVKLSENGAHLWSKYLGGSDIDYGRGIAVDGAGNVFVTGGTYSANWVWGGFNTTFNGGIPYGEDAFLVKLSGSGSHLWSTYLGGNDDDDGSRVAVDSAGNVLVTGGTESSGWVSGGFDTTLGDYLGDAFVVKLSGRGSHLWSTYLGGRYNDEGEGIALDGAGNVFVTGWTNSSGWVSGGFDTTFNGGYDAFVTKILTVVPSIDVIPASLDFGEWPWDAGTTGPLTVTLENWGSAPLEFNGSSAIAIIGNNPGDFEMNPSAATTPIPPGESRTVNIYFDPSASGPRSAILRIMTNAPNEGIVDVPLTGEGIEQDPDIRVTPASLDFGSWYWELGATGPLTITIENRGADPLEFNGSSAFTIISDNASDFEMNPSAATTPLAHGENRAVSIYFDPSASGPRSAILRIMTNDPDEGTVDVPLTGVGIEAPDIQVTPASLDFGEWPWDGGTTGPLTLTIENQGAAALELIRNGIEIVGNNPWDFQMNLSSAATPIAPGENWLVNVSFDPPIPFPRSAILRITTNDPDEATVDIPLTGKGTGKMPATARKDWMLFE